MIGMFSSAESFNGDLSAWDVSSVRYMGFMFREADSFNGDLSAWDVSSVTDMGSMFRYAESFNGDLSSWDVSSVTDMSSMFYSADSFNGDLSSWDVSSVTDMGSMFSYADSFDSDLSAWDVSSVTDMSSIFYNTSLSQAHYEKILIGWSTQEVHENIDLGTIDLLVENDEAITARTYLIDEKGWTIDDLGLKYTITYHLNDGVNHEENPNYYTSNRALVLKEASYEGFVFVGWYDNSDFEGNAITEIAKGTEGTIELWARWTLPYGILAMMPTMGTGTEADPYQISSIAELRWLSEGGMFDGITEQVRWESHYVLTADIDAREMYLWNSGKGLKPIGNNTNAFKGSLDGQGHRIYNLLIDNTSEDNQGLFGRLNGAEIKHLKLENASVKGNDAVGLMAGYASASNISDVRVAGEMEANENVGGLVGTLVNSTITRSSATININASKNVGGLVGLSSVVYGLGNSDKTEMSYSFATGKIEGVSHLGGILGKGTSGVDVMNAYTIVEISGTSEIGGIAGENNGGATEKTYAAGKINASGANVGGVIGVNSTGIWVEKSYWDKETTTVTTSAGQNDSNGFLSADFENQNKFSTWDFTNDWVITKLRYDDVKRPYFKWQTIEITATTDGNGEIRGDVFIVESGDRPMFTVVPNEGYKVAKVTVNEQEVKLDKNLSFTITDVTEATTIHATFELQTFDIVVTQGENGEISPSTTTVNYGSSQVFTITPSEGYGVADVLVDGVSLGALSEYTFDNVTESHEITATFVLQSFEIEVTQSEGGEISPSTATVNYGESETFTIMADEGYEVSEVLVDGESVGAVSEYTFENVIESHEITATFVLQSFEIEVTQSEGGVISPETSVVNYGEDVTFTITANSGYNIANVLVDGESVGVASTYTFENVTAAHEITAEFSKITGSDDGFEVYQLTPNPSSNWVQIKGAKPHSRVQFVSMQGVTVKTVTLKQADETISVQGFASGMYIVLLDGQQIGKLVKE